MSARTLSQRPVCRALRVRCRASAAAPAAAAPRRAALAALLVLPAALLAPRANALLPDDEDVECGCGRAGRRSDRQLRPPPPRPTAQAAGPHQGEA